MKINLLVAGLFLSFACAQIANAASTFTINEGWNLVSSQIVAKFDQPGISIEEFITNGGALYTLNRIDKKYYGGSGDVSVANASMEKMFQMLSDGDDGVHALGWWLYSPQKIERTFDFSVATDDVRDYQDSYHFNRGWNLVSITPPLQNKSLTSLKGSCNFISVYNFENGAWRKQSDIDMGEKFTNDSLGHALAIKVENDCVFNFKGGASKSSLPALPE